MLQLNGDTDFVRGCYYLSSSQYRKGDGRFLPENYVPDLCTHIYYAFAGMNPDFTIKPLDANDETKNGIKGMYKRVLDLKQVQPSLSVILSFGGYAFSRDNEMLLQFMISSQQTRSKFIESVVKLLPMYGFDGFDVAWLYPTSKDYFTVFLRDLKVELEKNHLILTASVSGASPVIKKMYDIHAIGQILDFINVISYSFHGPWETVTGHNSPLYDRNGDQLSVTDAAETWHKNGVPKNKIVLGLASFAHGWTLSSNRTDVGSSASGPSIRLPFTQEPGVASYYELCKLPDKDTVRFYDENQQNMYLIYNQTFWFSYDNKTSFNSKLQWIEGNRFRGVNVWALDQDDFNGKCSNDGQLQKFPLLSLLKDFSREPAPTTTYVPKSHPGK